MTDYRVKIYKKDARYKKGERLENTSEYRSQTEASLQENLDYLKNSFPEEQGFRIQHYPSTIVVKNLMTGAHVEIDADTFWSCRPDFETYWSM
jgi:hypothetical protein